ncbi:MAG TPA: glycosyltransferase [Thermoanaerobaculia bacterium]|nr:glycosyltransferase [Thermoanaerobaculia bacterium]
MITIAIPTYNRGAILVETIERLLALTPRAAAIVIVDQTRQHPTEIERRLRDWDRDGAIRWLRLDTPSIPRAMNDALVAAETPLVLFLDDDIVPHPRLVAAHEEAHRDAALWAVAGQVLQPGEEPEDFEGTDDLEFHFNSNRPRRIANVMAGNLSVKRDRALAIGGFDENFTGAAYRFETDFAMRVAAAGGAILFEPRGSIRHLKLSSGGLRSFGDHRAVASAAHTAGDYYFALHHVRGFWRYAARRLAKNVLTRYHATHPWSIPAKIAGELRGLILAKRLYRKGRVLRAVTPDDPGNRNR